MSARCPVCPKADTPRGGDAAPRSSYPGTIVVRSLSTLNTLTSEVTISDSLSGLEKRVNVSPPDFAVDQPAATLVKAPREPSRLLVVRRPTETLNPAAKTDAAPDWKRCRHPLEGGLLFGSHAFPLVRPRV